MNEDIHTTDSFVDRKEAGYWLVIFPIRSFAWLRKILATYFGFFFTKRENIRIRIERVR